jgi:hypothetical protein
VGFKSIAIIVDDFSYRSFDYENVYFYDYMVESQTTYFDDYYYNYYLDLNNPFGYGTIDRSNTTNFDEGYFGLGDTMASTLVSSQTSSPIFDWYEPTVGIFAYEGYTYSESYFSRLPPISFDSTQPNHGDWVLKAFKSNLAAPENVEIIAIDVDFTNYDYRAVFSNDVIEAIVEDAFNNIYDPEHQYFLGGLTASFGGNDFSLEQDAISNLLSSDTFVVQAAPNTGQSGINWGEYLGNIINVGAYNVDQSGDLLFADIDDISSIDIYANGFIQNQNWSPSWSFGTSFAAPRVFAEIFNLFEQYYPYFEENPDQISYEDLTAQEETAVTNMVVEQISSELDIKFTGASSFNAIVPVLTSDLENGLTPQIVPEDYPTALPWTVDHANFAYHKIWANVTTRNGNAFANVDVVIDTLDNDVIQKTGANGQAFAVTDAGISATIKGKSDFENSTKPISSSDALDALKLSVGLKTSLGSESAFDLISADFNRDGRVSSQDALSILKYSVGLTTEHSAQWIFLGEDKDYSEISRLNTVYDEGVLLTELSADTSVDLIGILVGDVNDSFIA